MTFDEYQKLAHRTSKNVTVGGDTLVYPLSGLANEAGEALGVMKKVHRDRDGKWDGASGFMLMRELGDVMWYLAEACTQMNVTMQEVAEMNLDKLADRQRRGVIGGSGDER